MDRTEKQLDNLEQLVHDIEFAQVERRVLDGLKVGNEALKAANAMFSIEEIEQIMDDTEDAVEKQKEIDAMLTGQERKRLNLPTSNDLETVYKVPEVQAFSRCTYIPWRHLVQ